MDKKNLYDMASISYIEHRKRMYRAYKKNARLRTALIASNLIWAVCLLAYSLMR